ncbi:MAG: hypothetical protein GMKNLPBB_02463 [Myxococcota bacterium]|nr:hypothetical protein [Myxococcota bacterium]
MEHILLTGATGFLGREILWRNARKPDTEVICIVRAKDEADARRRVDELLDAARPALTPGQRSRVTPLSGDLTLPRLGLTEEQYDRLAERVTRIVHGAASVQFDLPLAEAREINVEGTRKMLDFGRAALRKNALKRFDYVGTSYIAGKRPGVIGEEELGDRHGFHNTYEQTKFEAEGVVRQHRGELPIAMFRPSIIVGDSRTGYTASFKVLYWPLKVYSRGLVFVVPGDPNGRVDIVPVDYVCDALEVISARADSRGKAFHLTAGPEASSTIREMLDLASGEFRVRKPLLIRPEIYYGGVRPILVRVLRGKWRRVLETGKVYAPYLSHQAIFDTAQTRAALEGSGVRVVPVREYFRNLIHYCLETDWGKKSGAGG